jgi:molybdopterin converting factor subunit 1
VRIQVLHFAAAREAAGCASESVELPEGATVADAKALLFARHPALFGAAARLRFAVGERFAPESERLEAGDVLALLPPVSGG